MIQKKIFYDDKPVHITGFKADNSISFKVQLGYIPEDNCYVAVRKEDPWFCFVGNTLDDVKSKARRALEFYVEHGLQDITTEVE